MKVKRGHKHVDRQLGEGPGGAEGNTKGLLHRPLEHTCQRRDLLPNERMLPQASRWRPGTIKHKAYAELGTVRKARFYPKTSAHREFSFSPPCHYSALAFRGQDKPGSETRSTRCEDGRKQHSLLFLPSPKTESHDTPEIARVRFPVPKDLCIRSGPLATCTIVSPGMTIYGMFMECTDTNTMQNWYQTPTWSCVLFSLHTAPCPQDVP